MCKTNVNRNEKRMATKYIKVSRGNYYHYQKNEWMSTKQMKLRIRIYEQTTRGKTKKNYSVRYKPYTVYVVNGLIF